MRNQWKVLSPTLRLWSLSRACPMKFVVGDWDNGSDKSVIGSVTLTLDVLKAVR